jgi:acyl-CoA reductase-like NAD-dependent aldehyde dehydrogenase
MPMRESNSAEQISLFVATHRSRPPSWPALPAEVRTEVIRLLSELLRDRALRRARGEGCDE